MKSLISLLVLIVSLLTVKADYQLIDASIFYSHDILVTYYGDSWTNFAEEVPLSPANTITLSNKLTNPYGSSSQYIKGDGTLGAFPVLTNGVNGSNGTNGLNGSNGAIGATGATGSVGADGALSIQRVRGQTDASGNATITFSPFFGSGIIPVITATAEGSSGTQINVQIVSSTRSNAVFKVYSLPTQTLLGISVGVPTPTQAYIDITAIAP